MDVRNKFVGLASVLVFALGVGCEGCAGCEEQPPEEPPKVEPDVGVTVEDEPEDTLEEEKANAEELAIEAAVSRGDVARNVAARIEANAKKPTKPTTRKPRVAEKTGGTIDAAAVKQVFGMNGSAFKKCYERSLKKFPGLEGKVMLTVVIGGNGSVRSASVRGVSLKNATVNDCIKRQAETMKFPEPSGGSVTVNKAYTFTPDF